MQWKDPVATPDDLPTTWNKVNDHRWCKSDGFVYKFDGEERAKVKVPWDWWVDTLSQLTDVSLADLTNGDVLSYDSTSEKFKNKAIFNPTITTPSDWEVLGYNGTSERWENKTIFNPTITTPVEWDVLSYNGTSDKWENKAIFNPTITSPVEWQILKYNGTAFVNANEKTELPTLPSVDGNYHLKCTVSDGTATLSWEAQV